VTIRSRSTPSRAQLESWLTDGVRRMGLTLTDDQRAQFLRYLELLQQWGRKINLTAILEPQAVIDRHFSDSLALWSAVTPVAGGHLLDVGAGAGFPGVPLKLLAPSIKLTLLEPRQKRSAFLQVLMTTLGASGYRVITTRLEALPSTERFDWIVARGVGKLDQLIAQAVPHLTPTGMIALYLSTQQKSNNLPSGYRTVVHRYRLPFSAVERQLLIVQFP
jgi:16S rRNA (guanine527-N7)-methyltransferase